MDVKESQSYLDTHNVAQTIDDLVKHLLVHRPEDPMSAIADWSARNAVVRRLHMVRRGTLLDHNKDLSVYSDSTKAHQAIGIVATIGPVSKSVETLKEMIKEGMTIARLNISHGSHDSHRELIRNIRQAAKELGKIVAIALDSRGPEIRTGYIHGDLTSSTEVSYKVGDVLTLTTDPAFRTEGTKEKLFVNYAGITKVLKVGDHIYVDDGQLDLLVEEVGADYIKAVAETPATICALRGVNLPSAVVDLPTVSEQDKEDLKFAIEEGVDILFASFIRTPSQVDDIRSHLGEAGKKIIVIAKIENNKGVLNFDAILEKADGIMVARGDLGSHIPIEKVFVAQKMMASKCNIKGKPCIVATQMLESMTKNPRPTRAEVGDVANAVLDGADALMLSAETARGSYPVLAVSVVRRVSIEAQLANREEHLFESVKAMRSLPLTTQDSIGCCAVNSAFELPEAKGIVILTKSGATARIVAKYRPPCPIIAITQSDVVARQLLLHRYVMPLLTTLTDREERIQEGVDYCKKLGLVKKGQQLILVHGTPECVASLTRIIIVA